MKLLAIPITNFDMNTNEICVIKDKDTREEFLPAYRSALKNKGFVVRVLEPGSDIASCSLTSTYTGSWSRDIVMYMASAEIVAYKNGTKLGDAIFDAPNAGTALTTEIYESTEVKITKMVDQLFPDFVVSKEKIELQKHAVQSDSLCSPLKATLCGLK